jgi:caa(3)-type oxidase subunit IV
MTEQTAKGYRVYWSIWIVLLVLTVVMLALDGAPVPRGAFVALMLVAMMVKATLIGAYFMHLRFERLGLVLTIVVGLLLNATILYVLIAPDALRILGMSQK